MIKAAKTFAINQLEPRFYGALWYAGAGLIAAMIALASLDRSKYSDEIVFLGALLAIVLGTVGWIWSGRMGILMARKTNAMALLERLSSDHTSQLKTIAYEYMAAYNDFQNQDCAKPRPEMPEREVEQLLSIYEQASVAVVYGAVNHDMLKQAQFLVFKRIYLGLRHHIDKVQEMDAAYFEYFERLTCTWHPELQRKTATFKIDGGLFNPMQGTDV